MQVTHKGEVDLVAQLKRARPSFERFAAAEPDRCSPRSKEKPQRKAPDGLRTLDGTNFVHGFPFFCVRFPSSTSPSLAGGHLRHPNRRSTGPSEAKEPTATTVPPRVSPCAELNNALVASGFAYDRRSRADFYLRYVKSFFSTHRAFDAAVLRPWI